MESEKNQFAVEVKAEARHQALKELERELLDKKDFKTLQELQKIKIRDNLQ